MAGATYTVSRALGMLVSCRAGPACFSRPIALKTGAMAGTEAPRPDVEAAALVPQRWFAERAANLQLTRFVLLRGMGFIYLVAFTILVRQVLPLIGEHGLMPAARFLERVRQAQPSASSSAAWSAFSNLPSLFW